MEDRQMKSKQPKPKYRKRVQHVADIGKPEEYEYFLKLGGALTKEQFTEANARFYELAMDELLLREKLFYLPGSFGYMVIEGKLPDVQYDEDFNQVVNKQPVDWKRTKALWDSNAEAKAAKKLIRHKNNGTSGKVFRLKWYRARTKVRGLGVYEFRPAKYTYKRRLAHKLQENGGLING